MGNGKTLKCRDCGCEKNILFGIGFGAPSLAEELHKDALAGKYGDTWKQILEGNKNLRIQVDKALYVCPACGDHENTETCDIGEDFMFRHDIVREYVHSCNKCGATMMKCTEKDLEGIPTIRCKECGGEMELSEQKGILWD